MADDDQQLRQDLQQAAIAMSLRNAQQAQIDQAATQAATQKELLERLIFEQQIAGFSNAEKQLARADRKLGLDPLEMQSLPLPEQKRRREERRAEIERELEEEEREIERELEEKERELEERLRAQEKEEARERARQEEGAEFRASANRIVAGIVTGCFVILLIYAILYPR